MAALLFSCPVTGKTTNAHLEIDGNSLEGLNTSIMVQCYRCGKQHSFQMRDGRLRENKLADGPVVAA
jgi:hypothetical protein